MLPNTPSTGSGASRPPAPQGLATRILSRLSVAVVAAIVSLFVFVLLAHDVHEQDTLRFDRGILNFFQAHQWPPLHVFLRLVSQLAGPRCQSAVVIAALGYFTWRRRFFPDGLALLVAGVGGALLMVGLKRLFHRPRPEVIFDQLGFSFPSGHSFFALVVYGMLAYWLARDLPRKKCRVVWCVAVFAILLVGFSRVFLGEHFPSDVIAGFAVGLPWLWGCLALPTYLRRTPPVPPAPATL